LLRFTITLLLLYIFVVTKRKYKQKQQLVLTKRNNKMSRQKNNSTETTKVMPQNDKSCITIEPEEVLFFYQNVDAPIKKLVRDELLKNGVKVSRQLVDKELRTHKPKHDRNIITTAREILFRVKQISFNS